MKSWRFALFILVMHALSSLSHGAGKSEVMTFDVDGVARRALVFAPAKGGRGKLPVLFAFHGSGDNVEHFSIAGFHDAWPEALVIYMQALERRPGRGDTSFQTTDGGPDNPDLKFFDQVLTEIRQKFRIDDGRIFAAGFSNGARFVYLLWAARSRIFAAFAPVAGTLALSLKLAVPKPMIQIGGREDRTVNYKQQMESVEVAKELNEATGPGEPCGTLCTLYRSPIGAPVISVAHPGGHFFPSFAADAIVSFFRSRPAN